MPLLAEIALTGSVALVAARAALVAPPRLKRLPVPVRLKEDRR